MEITAVLETSRHCHGDEKTFIFVLPLRAKVKLNEGGLGAQHEGERTRAVSAWVRSSQNGLVPGRAGSPPESAQAEPGCLCWAWAAENCCPG